MGIYFPSNITSNYSSYMNILTIIGSLYTFSSLGCTRIIAREVMMNRNGGVTMEETFFG